MSAININKNNFQNEVLNSEKIFFKFTNSLTGDMVPSAQRT